MASEHTAIILSPDECDSYKKKKAGNGVNLILCNIKGKLSAQSYTFNPKLYNPLQAKAWLQKADIKYETFEEAEDMINAKLAIHAKPPGLDGKVWSSGLHHVFVNDKPSRVYVPPETIIDTFNNMRSTIEQNGHLDVGIDHLSDKLLNENGILAKMNLLDVGDINSIVTDGEGIYIKESQITNDAIQVLHEQGELPAYSIVGEMEASPCPKGEADYIINSIDVTRVDIVDEGGCTTCKVGVQPDNIILTAKLNKGDEIMAADEVAPDTVEQVEETVKEVTEEPTTEKVEQVKEDVKEVVEEVVEVVEEQVDEEPSELQTLRDEIADLKKIVKEDLGGKKPPVIEFDAEQAVSDLIKAGRATPKMKPGLLEVAGADPEAFQRLAATLPRMVNMKMESKLAQIEKDNKEAKKKPKTWDDEFGSLAKHFRV